MQSTTTSNLRSGRLLHALILQLLFSCFVAGAKAQTDAPLSFEAATLKEVPDDQVPPLSPYPRVRGDRFTWSSSPGSMLAYAYQIPRTQIEGIDSLRHFFTVEATMAQGTTDEQARVMLRQLLVESMKIECHRDQKSTQGYVLLPAKGGSKLKPAGQDDPLPPMPKFMGNSSPKALSGRVLTSRSKPGVEALVGRSATMSQLATELSVDLKAPVIDQTGLSGKYYFGFEFQVLNETTEDSQNGDAFAASVFSALSDALGLRLQRQKVPSDYLIIDHIEKPNN